MSENELGKAKRIIIVTELPTRHKIESQTFDGETRFETTLWEIRSVWQVNVLENGHYKTAYCHTEKDLVRVLLEIISHKHVGWISSDKIKKNVLRWVMNRIEAFGE